MNNYSSQNTKLKELTHSIKLGAVALLAAASLSSSDQVNAQDRVALEHSLAHDLNFNTPALVVQPTSPTANLNLNFPMFREAAVEVSQFQKVSETESISDTSMRQLAKREALSLLRENWAAVLAGVGAPTLVVWRHFPTKLNVDNTQIGELVKLQALGGQRVTPQQRILTTSTLWSADLSEMFGLDAYAFIRFQVGLLKARIHNFWPILSFSNSKMNQHLGGAVDDLMGRPTRSETNAILRGEDGSINSVTSAVNMFQNGINKDTIPQKNAGFLVYTFERLDDVYQPRLYYIPAADIVNCLVDMKDWWQAAKNTSTGAQRRLVRSLEIAGSLIYRYPKMLESLFDNHPKFQSAKQVAHNIRRMYALSPNESLHFIEKFLEGDRSKELLEPTKEEWAKLMHAWYDSNDPKQQKELGQSEQQIQKLSQYAAFCKQHNSPMWFFNLYV